MVIFRVDPACGDRVRPTTATARVSKLLKLEGVDWFRVLIESPKRNETSKTTLN